jgi:hypothetical protein
MSPARISLPVSKRARSAAPRIKPARSILAGGVEAGHFGGLAADQRAAVLAAAARESGYDLSGCARFEFASGKVVEEEERHSTLHGDVVHVVIYESSPTVS